jgi:hypothetical protein
MPAADDETPAPSPLAEIVDDLTPRQDALEWATAEIAAGRPFDDVATDLRAAGWSEPDTADLVELARRQTRAQRGVVTRGDVVQDVNRRYRRAMTPGWFLGMPTVAAAMRLLYALSTLASLRRRRRNNNNDDDNKHSPPNPNPDKA